MKFLEIKSKGEMDIKAISLIGASTKRGDENKIGMFGSGLKYAVASIVRQDIPFFVFSGENEIRISTKEVNFGGKTFNQIYINGNETSLTDSMGTEDWAGIFPFIREIYSNALDEDENAEINITEDIIPEAGYTKFFISGTDDVLLFMKQFSDYFMTEDDILHKNEIGSIGRKKDCIRIFRKGILAYKDDREDSLFSYDVKRLTINESRIASNSYEVKNRVAEMLENCTDATILRSWINGIANNIYQHEKIYETDAILYDWYGVCVNPTLVSVILENKYYAYEIGGLLEKDEMYGRICLPMKLLSRFLKYAPDVSILGMSKNDLEKDKFFVIKTPSTRLFNKVCDAIAELKQTSYSERIKNEIQYASFNNEKWLGLAKDNIIYLSIKLDTYSVSDIAKIIIEEQEHLHSGHEDETRHFQNHLFNLYYDELTTKR